MFCICVKKPLPPDDNPIAVNKYYYYYYYRNSMAFSLFVCLSRKINIRQSLPKERPERAVLKLLSFYEVRKNVSLEHVCLGLS
jgi:hypothetical protein